MATFDAEVHQIGDNIEINTINPTIYNSPDVLLINFT